MEPLTAPGLVLLVSLCLLGYSYLGYPVLLWIGSLFVRTKQPTPCDDVAWPEVTVIVSAHNEEAVIARRIDNLLELDYPPHRLKIFIGSDGSTDRTASIVRSYRTPRITLFDFPLRRGKATVLNESVAKARSRYVVFTDANTFFAPDAVKQLIAAFRSTPSACAVVGRLIFRTAEGTVNPDSLYWRYETWLKTLESDFGTVLGANGAIYAVERARYRPLPPGTIVDDFLVPMLMRLTGGGSVVFRPEATAWETVPQTVQDEFRRRVRIGAGDVHALYETWRLLLPAHGMLALSYWSHKVLRWLGPWLLILAFVSNLLLLDRPWGRALMALQGAGYTLGIAAPLVRRLPVVGRTATAASYFIALNAALLLGALKFLSGRSAPVWQTTPRTAEILQWTPQRTSDSGRRAQKERPAA